jgi:hypothetical protein
MKIAIPTQCGIYASRIIIVSGPKWVTVETPYIKWRGQSGNLDFRRFRLAAGSSAASTLMRLVEASREGGHYDQYGDEIGESQVQRHIADMELQAL